MNKGVIINFLLFVVHSFADWLDASILGKAGRAVGRLWKAVTKNSFIVKNLTNAPAKLVYRDTSLFFKAVKAIFEFFRTILSKMSASIRSSAIVCALKWYFDGFFAISTAHYGIFMLCASAVYFVLRFATGGFAIGYFAVCAAAALIAVLAVFINLPLSALLGGSRLAGVLAGFLGIKAGDETEQINVSRVSGIVFCIAGVLCGALCFKFGAVYGLAAFALLLFVCAVIYNFRLGVYMALIAFPFSPTMAIVGIMLLSIVSLALKYITDKDFKFIRTALDIPLVFLLAVMLLSTVTSFALGSSLKIYLVYFVFIAGYFAITNAITDFKSLLPVLGLMLIAALGVSAYGIYQHIFGFAEGTTWTDTDMFEDIATRVVSTFDNPNVLGEYLLILIPLGAAMFLSVKNGFAKTAHLAITAALGVCMIYTYSRGNWIGLITALFMFIMFYDTRFVWLGVIAVFAVPFVMSQSVISRFTSIGDTKDTSTSYRVYIWMGTFNMLKDYWLCGIGLGSDAFNTIYPHYSYAGIVAPHSHNLYLQLLVENGILGLISFLVLIFAYFRAVISKITTLERGVPKAVITALAAGIFGYLVQGMFDNVWYNYRVFFMFFAVLALTMAAINASRRGRNRD